MQALEKAVADVFPNASKKIESNIKNVSNQTYSRPLLPNIKCRKQWVNSPNILIILSRSRITKHQGGMCSNQSLRQKTLKGMPKGEGIPSSCITIKFLVFFILWEMVYHVASEALYNILTCLQLYRNTLRDIFCCVQQIHQ